MTDEAGQWDEFIPEIDTEQLLLVGGLEQIVDLGIVEAYRRWCGKSEVVEGGRTESIMVSCPKPDHPDKIPSAWLNSEKNVWFCGACNEGGDIIDLGAIRFGFPIPGYKEGRNFPELIEMMLVDMGVDVEAMKKRVEIEAIEAREISRGVETGPAIVPVVDPDYREIYPRSPLNWKELAPEGSFLRNWMDATSPSSWPDEYLFFLGLQMISMAIRKESWLVRPLPVYGNLYLALLGGTGIGKSNAIRLADKVVKKGLEFDADDPHSKGTKEVPRPGSGEVLIDHMSWLPPGAMDPAPVSGWLQMDEMSELMKTTGSRGNTLREAFIKMYDAPPEASTSSRGSGTIVAKHPYLNVIVGAQPDAMGDILSGNDVASGFANRFMYVSGTRKPRKAWDDETTIDLAGLDVQLRAIQAWVSGGKPIMLDMEAADRMDEILPWIDGIVSKEGDVFSRLELHLYKFVILLTVNDKVDITNLETLERAKALVDFLIPAALDVELTAGVTDRARYTERVMDIIEWFPSRRGGEYPTAAMIKGEMSKSMRKQPDMINWAIETLVRQGHIIEAPKTKEDVTSGRTKVRYRLPA